MFSTLAKTPKLCCLSKTLSNPIPAKTNYKLHCTARTAIQRPHNVLVFQLLSTFIRPTPFLQAENSPFVPNHCDNQNVSDATRQQQLGTQRPHANERDKTRRADEVEAGRSKASRPAPGKAPENYGAGPWVCRVPVCSAGFGDGRAQFHILFIHFWQE